MEYVVRASHKHIRRPKIVSILNCVHARSSGLDVFGRALAGNIVKKYCYCVGCDTRVYRIINLGHRASVLATAMPTRPVRITKRNKSNDSQPSRSPASQVLICIKCIFSVLLDFCTWVICVAILTTLCRKTWSTCRCRCDPIIFATLQTVIRVRGPEIRQEGQGYACTQYHNNIIPTFVPHAIYWIGMWYDRLLERGRRRLELLEKAQQTTLGIGLKVGLVVRRLSRVG